MYEFKVKHKGSVFSLAPYFPYPRLGERVTIAAAAYYSELSISFRVLDGIFNSFFPDEIKGSVDPLLCYPGYFIKIFSS